MITIRHSIFETNSSSVHVLVIPKDAKIIIPNVVYLHRNEYGWSDGNEFDTLSYFYQACVDRGTDEVLKLVEYLKRKGVEEIHCREIGSTVPNFSGFIDHSEEIPLDYLFSNENLLDRFIFGSESFVEIGNDNDEYCPRTSNYDANKYDTIKKGN